MERIDINLNEPPLPPGALMIFNKVLSPHDVGLKGELVIPASANESIQQHTDTENVNLEVRVSDYTDESPARLITLRRPRKGSFKFGRGWHFLIADHNMEAGGRIWVYGRAGGNNNDIILYYECPALVNVVKRPRA